MKQGAVDGAVQRFKNRVEPVCSPDNHPFNFCPLLLPFRLSLDLTESMLPALVLDKRPPMHPQGRTEVSQSKKKNTFIKTTNTGFRTLVKKTRKEEPKERLD